MGAKHMILIMAAGDIGATFPGIGAKQLAPICGEPLIMRTIRQLEERGGSPVVVTHKPDIQRLVPRYFVPQRQRWWPESLWSTQPLWCGHMVILQGDVVYSDRVMDMVLAEWGLRVFGTQIGKWETFAFTFDPEHFGRVAMALWDAVQHGERGHRAFLWEVYRSLCGISLFQLRAFERVIWKDVKEGAVDDWTNDLDTLEQYHKFLERHPWAKGDQDD